MSAHFLFDLLGFFGCNFASFRSAKTALFWAKKNHFFVHKKITFLHALLGAFPDTELHILSQKYIKKVVAPPEIEPRTLVVLKKVDKCLGIEPRTLAVRIQTLHNIGNYEYTKKLS